MKIYLTFFALILPFCFNAQGIEFYEGTWAEALEKAKEQERAIFVDSYTTWCGPCKRMAKQVFTLEEVGEFFNANFINMKLDMEKEEGMKFGKKFPVSAYPTLYFISDKEEVIIKSVGGKSPDDLIALGKEAMASNDRSGDYAEKFENGERDYDMVLKYVQELNKVGKPSLAVANKYLREKPEITKEQKAMFLLEAATEVDSKLFDQLLEVKELAIQEAGLEAYQEKVQKAGKKTVKKAIEHEYEELLTEAITKMKSADPDNANIFEYKSLMSYSKAFKTYGEWAKYAKKYYKKSGKNYDTYKTLLADVKSYYKDNKDAEKEMYKWYDEMIKCEECNENEIIAYSQFLFQNGDKKKAVEVAEFCLSKSKEEGKPTKKIEQYIQYLEKQS